MSSNESMPSHFGRYQILGPLGRGGMGAVFKAVAEGPEGFRREVALKVVLQSRGLDAEGDALRLKMFQDEARLVARLTHPGIAQVFDFGVEAGRSYLVMELLDGSPFSQQLSLLGKQGKRMPDSVVLAVGTLVAEALAYAHALPGEDGSPLGLVHRDVTPDNLQLTQQGFVKLMDFGIALGRGRQTETQLGMVKGKPRYMSPEQIQGLALDGRSDVFSLGVVLWEALAGRCLWSAELPEAIAAKLMYEEIPDLEAVNPDLHPAASEVVMALLARDPKARPDAAAAASLLRQAGRVIDPRAPNELLLAWSRDEFEPPTSAAPRGMAASEGVTGPANRGLAVGTEAPGVLAPGTGTKNYQVMSVTPAATTLAAAAASTEPRLMAVQTQEDEAPLELATEEPSSWLESNSESLAANADRAASNADRAPDPHSSAPRSDENTGGGGGGGGAAPQDKPPRPAPSSAHRPSAAGVFDFLQSHKVAMAGLGAILILTGVGTAFFWPTPPPPPDPNAGTVLLRINSRPAGASVQVNGKLAPGVTPLSVRTLALREHALTFKLAGYVPTTAKISYERVERPILVTLDRLYRIKVETRPPGAQILSAGRVVIASTPGTFERPNGVYNLEARAVGFASQIKTLEIKAKEAHWAPHLVRAASLRVVTVPPGAQVKVDGVLMSGVTPLTAPAPSRKRIKVEAFKDRLVGFKRLRSPKPGRSASVRLRLKDPLLVLERKRDHLQEEADRISGLVDNTEDRLNTGILSSTDVRELESQRNILAAKRDRLYQSAEALENRISVLQDQQRTRAP